MSVLPVVSTGKVVTKTLQKIVFFEEITDFSCLYSFVKAGIRTCLMARDLVVVFGIREPTLSDLMGELSLLEQSSWADAVIGYEVRR